MSNQNLKSLCEEYFETDNLYQALGLEKNANEKDVKNAYRRMSLKIHPDRVEESEKENATEKFKVLSKIHSILSDPKKRKAYDDNGDTEDDVDCDWMMYWRSIFKQLTLDDIKEYEQKYKGSEEERNDLKDVYLSSKGNMDVIMETVLFAQLEDEPRLCEILQDMIKSGEVEDFEAFTQESRDKKKRRERKMKRQRKAFEKMQEKEQQSKDNDFESLQMAISKNCESRQGQFNGFLEALEKKYTKPGAAKKGTRTSTRNK
ncbi:hypothetical protein B566_EDAN011243 [Ephemera danica]|nr:hypothetical protein B566_EDAN011243 [Ephemera danica]